jgi:hypothetical protein
VASEAHGAGGLWRGELREFAEGRPTLMFSAPFKSALVAVVEEVGQRRVTPPPASLQAEWRSRLRSWSESEDALRALGYFQDAADRELLRERRAGPALLLLGDPAALELRPRLEPHEIEMALRKAEDPRVREYLEEPANAGVSRDRPGRVSELWVPSWRKSGFVILCPAGEEPGRAGRPPRGPRVVGCQSRRRPQANTSTSARMTEKSVTVRAAEDRGGRWHRLSGRAGRRPTLRSSVPRMAGAQLDGELIPTAFRWDRGKRESD